jgi:predicted GNAT family N-acyltransferase
MLNVIFKIENELNDELISLRKSDFFNDEFEKNEVIDKFDESSMFSFIKVDKEIIGFSRITDTSIVSVFDKWSKGKDITPKGRNCYEITRAVISKRWRNKGMYHVLTTCTLKFLKEHKAQSVNAILELGISLKNYIQRLGSIKCGEPYMSYDAPCAPVLVQAYTLNMADKNFSRIFQRECNRVINAINHIGFDAKYLTYIPPSETSLPF